MTSSRVRVGFNRLAPVYDRIARIVFGKRLIHAQLSLIDQIDHPKSILIFGGGTGQTLPRFLKEFPEATITFADISSAMIQRARKRIPPDDPRVTFLAGSYTDIPVNAQFDLIITPFVLDCFRTEELPVVIRDLLTRLSPSGTWWFTDFHNDSPSSWRTALIRLMYVFFQITCGLGVRKLPDFAREFDSAGLEATSEGYFSGRLLVSRLYTRRSAGNSQNRPH